MVFGIAHNFHSSAAGNHLVALGNVLALALGIRELVHDALEADPGNAAAQESLNVLGAR